MTDFLDGEVHGRLYAVFHRRSPLGQNLLQQGREPDIEQALEQRRFGQIKAAEHFLRAAIGADDETFFAAQRPSWWY